MNTVSGEMSGIATMFKPLVVLFQKLIATGTLDVVTHDGRWHAFGDRTGKRIAIRLTDRQVEREIALDPNLAVGEAFADGRLQMLEASIYDFIALAVDNARRMPMPAWAAAADRLRYLTRRFAQYNPARRARRNVAHHYDIDGRIYDLFLDPVRQYSCAYFPTPDTSLDEAQRAKLRHIAAKLALRPEHSVLDIGSGWGGLALTLADLEGCRVDGVTLSEEQHAYANAWAARTGLGNRVRFSLVDYRHIQGQYDRIVSVGMFEHVGVNHYDAYFRKLAALLSENGTALIHFIARSDGPAATNAFIARHIFPGGYIPALSEVMPAIERSGLQVSDIEVLRLHYAMTLRHWRERFLANRERAVAIQGEAFCRMWEFYLAGSEAAFRYQNLVVLQIQLTRNIETLPLVRDYIGEAEALYAAAEPRRQAAE